MAGRPRWHAFLRKMENLGGIGYIAERVVAGESIKTIAHGLGVSVQMVYKFIHLTPEHEAGFREARKQGADTLVEQGQDLIDEADLEFPAAVQKATSQANFRKWRAGVDNRDQYGPPQQGLVQINLGDAFLGALRDLGGPVPALPEGGSELIEEG